MPKGFGSIDCRMCGLVPGAKILLRWVFRNTVGGALGALLGTIALIAVLGLTKVPEIRGHEPAFTVTFLSLYFVPAAVFAGSVSAAQRRLIIPYHHIGGGWIVASAIGSGTGAVLGLGLILIGPTSKAIHFAFGSSPVSASLSVGIGLGLGVGQWLYLRRLRFASLWIAANVIGMVVGDLVLGLALRLVHVQARGRDPTIITPVALGVLAWVVVTVFTGGTLVYLLTRSHRADCVRLTRVDA